MIKYEAGCKGLMGDMMMSLNKIHRDCWKNDTEAEVTFLWSKDKNWNWHSHDKDAAYERVDYIHQFYYQKDRVKIKHKFNCDTSHIHSTHLHREGKPVDFFLEHDWLFDPKFRKESTKGKVVVWDYLANKEHPKRWKTLISDWHGIYGALKENFDVVRIDYSTPIKEAVDHIFSAELCVGYEGCWHYVSRNIAKPLYITSNDDFTKHHTPHAVMLKDNKDAVKKLTFIDDRAFKKAEQYWEKLLCYSMQ